MSQFIAAIFGPRLYRTFDRRYSYEPNFFESGGDKMLAIGNCVYSICMGISPLLVPYIVFTWPISSYSTTMKAVFTFYAIAIALRTTGRFTNRDYFQFINVLESARSDPKKKQIRSALKQYDYQIFAAPTDFSAEQTQGKWFVQQPGEANSLGTPLNQMREVIAWIAANTFGRRILYPGSLEVFHSLANSQLIEGRRKLIEEKAGERNIVLTEVGDKLDTVFIDKRGEGDRGNTLIICCEGNAGFYEFGVMATPLSLGYSVLGWNMPGFAESTGTPYPESILSAMEAIIQFATKKLGFQPQHITLYAWSIGGFPATWAAANYPEIGALLLDASFDDLVPLAVAKMPSAISGLVTYTVRRHLNLPISEQLNRYKGPVRLVRRWNDEIIVTDESNEENRRASNRANWLLINLLKSRHSGLIQSDEDEKCIFDWLDKEPYNRLIEYPEEDSMEPSLSDCDFAKMDRESRHRMIRQLCAKYFVDFVGATHNVPLNSQYFNIPEKIG